jgi:2,4-dienoyl-CoA reductase-like NADH-dependent reductase (Old Yellow Enzyme family)
MAEAPQNQAMLFAPLTLRGVTLKNRVVMSPMHTYNATGAGHPSDFHLVHYGARALGGVGLVIQEVTAVDPRGRIRSVDLGLWDDAHVAPLKRVVDFVHGHGAKMGVQLGHAGRKGWSPDKGRGETPIVGPSPLPFASDWAVPQALQDRDLDGIVAAFVAATRRALSAGYDVPVSAIQPAHRCLRRQPGEPRSPVAARCAGSTRGLAAGSGALRTRLGYRLGARWLGYRADGSGGALVAGGRR